MLRPYALASLVVVLLCSSRAWAENDGKAVLTMAGDDYVVPSIPLDPIPRKKPKKPFPGVAFAKTGFAFGTTRTRADEAGDLLANHGNSLVLDTKTLIYVTDSDFTFRQEHGVRIGGGSAGFDGALSLDSAGGMRLRIAPDQGPFLRVGARGQLSGNHALFTSYIEVPQLQFGYQLMSSKIHAEIAFRSGLVLAGRYNIGSMGRRRTGGSLEVGGYGALNTENVKLEASLTRFDLAERNGSKPVDEFSIALCGVARKFAVCTDFRLYQGEVDIPSTLGESAFARASYAGLFVGGGYGN